jgi:DNA polymerase-3 subunit epsilon
LRDSEALARELEATGDYRILRRFRPEATPLHSATGSLATAVVLDVETTGFDAASDRIIQLSVLPFQYLKESGQIIGFNPPVTCFEDPGRPIPAPIVALTGITDADVAGQRLDEAAIEAATGSALVIAHNAKFDRPFMERRMPAFRDRSWACSVDDIPWKQLGLGSSAQEFLLLKHCRVFYEGHRADCDCQALLHLLATPFESGETPFQMLLQSARKKSARLWATGAPIEQKDLLKKRGYRWNPGEDGRPRAWHKEVGGDELLAEERWLSASVYGGQTGKWRVDALDARTRYSDRAGA